jgi:hypothetical protein
MREWVEGLGPDQRDFARVSGAVMLVAATLALFIRKATHHEWGSFGRLLIVLIPCVVLFALGLEFAERPGGDVPAVDRGLYVRGRRLAPAWQSTCIVGAVVLVPFVLVQFLDLIGGNTNDSLNAAWIFLLTAAIAMYGALATGVRYAALLSGLALIVSWLTFWDKVASPSATTDRDLLILIGLILAAGAVLLERERLRQGTELMTAAGIAGLVAGVLGLVAAAASAIGQRIASAFGSTNVPTGGLRQHQEWDVFLIALAVFLIWYGARRAVRGPTYVGALALLAFAFSVGFELTRILSASAPHGGFFGWPALLLVLAVAGLLVGFSRQPPAPVEAQQPPPPGPPPPAL